MRRTAGGQSRRNVAIKRLEQDAKPNILGLVFIFYVDQNSSTRQPLTDGSGLKPHHEPRPNLIKVHIIQLAVGNKLGKPVITADATAVHWANPGFVQRALGNLWASSSKAAAPSRR